MLTSKPNSGDVYRSLRRAVTEDAFLAIVAMLLLLALGLCFRSALFTPDEPREFDIAWNMLHQVDKMVPLLAGEPFCEKPPLTYWAAAAAMWIFGTEVWTARIPNLFWAGITLICLLNWTRSVVKPPLRNRALVFTALCAGSMFLLLRVNLWLATDAPLVATTAVALLGQWRGLNAQSSRERLFWYTLFHLGLVGAFFAKNLLGWLVPVISFIGMIVWERRWRELARWQLYAGLLLQAALLVPWLWFVYQHSDGARLLRIFLLDNSIGRFLPIATEEQYQLGHRNHFGKYFAELPYYLLPWTFAAVAALRWSYKSLRRRALVENSFARLEVSALRFALLSALPGLIFLSLSKTARDVYLAPELLGFSMLIGLWFGTGAQFDDRFDRICLRLTNIAAIGMGLILAIVSLTIPALQSQWDFLRTDLNALIAATTITLLLVLYVVSCWRSQWPVFSTVFRAWGMYATGVILVSVVLLPSMSESQDLRPTVRAIANQHHGRTLGVMRDDETIRAYLDFGARIRAQNFRSVEAAAHWLNEDAHRALVIELSTDHITPTARQTLTALHLNAIAPSDVNQTAVALQAQGFKLLSTHAVAGGRTYGVIGNATVK